MSVDEKTTIKELIVAAAESGGVVTFKLDEGNDAGTPDVCIIVAVGQAAQPMRQLLKDALALDEALAQ